MATRQQAQTEVTARERDRRFSVSANRGSARHRIRYVEAGGASVNTGECTFCQSNPELDWTAGTRQQDAAPSPGADSDQIGKADKD